MKRLYIFFFIVATLAMPVQAQQTNLEADTTGLFLDSVLHELPEIMVKGERPMVKVTQGKLVYDMPRLISKLPVDNAYDAIKELPGVVDLDGGLQLAGQGLTVILNGKVNTLTMEQLYALLKSMPASRIQQAEVMYSAPARYQVRGPLINVLLTTNHSTKPSLQGELYTDYRQRHYESLSERVSLLYSNAKFSADLLYSYDYGRGLMQTDKTAVHTLSDGSQHPMNLYGGSTARSNRHHIRLGMDATLGKKHALSFVYTAQVGNDARNGYVSGTQQSTTDSQSDSRLHDARLDYTAPFGWKAGIEFTRFESPSTQLLHSTFATEQIDFRTRDNQQIDKWRLYLSREHSLAKGWGLNYGVVYLTATDNSYQRYYHPDTDVLLPDNQMESHRREQTANAYTGFSKNLGEKLSVDASVAAELYHTDVWNEWNIYPTVNLHYTPADGHIVQFSLTADKKYPEFWSIQQAISYMGAYSEIHGNPLLKPASDYGATLSYILKSKYVFTLYFSHSKDRFMQLLYQSPEQLKEIYKVMNFDFAQQAGIQVTVPLSINKRLNTRMTAMGVYNRQKDSDFWHTSFDRRNLALFLFLHNTLTLSTPPDLKFTLSGMVRTEGIQGIYDLPASGNLDAALRYAFAGERAQLTLKCNDLFNTSGISPRIRFEQQQVTNHYLPDNRTFVLSFSYRFGGYKEKKRQEVDTSRFK